MDKSSKARANSARKKSSAEYWRTQISAYQASELSMERFCTSHHLKLYQFRYWLYRLRKLDKLDTDGGDLKPQGFIPVKVIDTKGASPSVPISSNRGVYFHYQDGKLVLEFPDLSANKIVELMGMIGGWYAQS